MLNTGGGAAILGIEQGTARSTLGVERGLKFGFSRVFGNWVWEHGK